MLRHFAKNKFWILTGVELIAIAYMFSVGLSRFDKHVPSSIMLISEPFFRFITYSIGTALIIQGIWDIYWYRIREVSRILAGGIAGVWAGAYWMSDTTFGHLSIIPLGMTFLLIRILVELLYNDTYFAKGEGKNYEL
ncbi:MAG: hypothetical protein LBT37_04170 [Lactobacillaceae bacterium]|jgi:hypothetical protein|nr:hypothetical protein [Lactobacillaceae bacterium]